MLHHAVEMENFEGLTEDQLALVNKVLDEVRPLREGADEVIKELKLNIDLTWLTQFKKPVTAEP